MAGSANGSFAIGFDNGTIIVGGTGQSDRDSSVGDEAFKCPTALTFINRQKLVVCQGSSTVKPSEMTRDLMQIGRTGSVWLLDLSNRHRKLLAGDLGYPYGVVSLPGSDDILISECWQHRILKLSLHGDHSPESVLSDLQGYPARLSSTTSADLMLCLFAPRNRLIEFVLKENEFRQRMIETIAPEYWIAPALKNGQNFLEPLQQGGVKTMNIHKPWAPSLSYGLVVRLGSDQTPVASYHSRANGQRHGITSCCEVQGQILATSKGGDCILKLVQRH